MPVKPDAMNGAGAGGIRAWRKLGREAPSPPARRSCTTWLSAPRMPWPWRTWQRRAQVPRCFPTPAHLPAACARHNVDRSARCAATQSVDRQQPSTAAHPRLCAAVARRRTAGMAGGPSRPAVVLMEGSWPVFLDRSLSSSRALERFRNQVPQIPSDAPDISGCASAPASCTF